jgi:hypothetical protein
MDLDLEGAIAHCRAPVVGHVRRQAVALCKLHRRNLLVALDLRHGLRRRHVRVVVEAEHDHADITKTIEEMQTKIDAAAAEAAAKAAAAEAAARAADEQREAEKASKQAAKAKAEADRLAAEKKQVEDDLADGLHFFDFTYVTFLTSSFFDSFALQF